MESNNSVGQFHLDFEMGELDYQTSPNELIAPQIYSSRAWRQHAQGGGAATIVLLLVAAAGHGTYWGG